MTDAIEFFTSELAFRTDVSDVHAALREPEPGFVLVDSRALGSWMQAHIPEAVHMPHAEIAGRARHEIQPGTPVVTYCWGPGCNGATRAALEFARLGYPVREMQGGIEYWIREGFPVDTPDGPVTRSPDPLTGPVSAISTRAVSCGC
jgi:rhodanese-related sulfurtransferase